MATRMGGAVWAVAMVGMRLETRIAEGRRSLASLMGCGDKCSSLRVMRGTMFHARFMRAGRQGFRIHAIIC